MCAIAPHLREQHGNTRRYCCIAWEKIFCITCIYHLPESDTLIGIRMFSTKHHRKFPSVQGFLCFPRDFPHYYSGILYQLLDSNQYFFKTTLVLSHHTTLHHTTPHITDSSIFISELLSLKPAVWLSQQFEIFESVIQTHLRKERTSWKKWTWTKTYSIHLYKYIFL